MTSTDLNRQEILDEIINRKKMGDKKFHSESSLQNFEEDGEPNEASTVEDPGILNVSMNSTPEASATLERRRTMSQPGPAANNLPTATAMRAARKRQQRNVAYADSPDDGYNKQLPLLIFPNKGDESGAITPNGGRNSPLQINNSYKNGDIKSLNSYRLYTPTNDIRGGGTPRKRSVATMDAQSVRSVETQAPPPTDPKEKKKLTRKYLSLIASCMYAILLVTVGLIIYLADHFIDENPAVYFSLILCSVGLIYHIYLIVDISRYKTKALKNQKIKARHEEMIAEFYRSQEDVFDVSSPGENTPYNTIMRRAVLPLPELLTLNHDYCFSQGRHSGSFYLKLGAAGFAMGHLIHSILLLAVQIGHLVDENVDNDECVDVLQIALDILYPSYCFVQLFFIFKYSNVIILKAEELGHFAFMHIIGSSLCFWISAIVRETVLGLTLYASSVYGNGYSTTTVSTNNPATTVTDIPYTSDPTTTISDGTYTTLWDTVEDILPNGLKYVHDSNFINIEPLYNPNCTASAAFTTIYGSFSPYLYPFSVEFNILIVAVYYIIWSNIGNCHNEESNTSENNSTSDDNYTICKIPTANEENDYSSNIIIHADCHASNRGMFLGLILLVMIAGMLIIGFVFSSVGDNFLEAGYTLNDGTKLALHSIMLFAALIAYMQIRNLDINEHPISLLDDVLLFICLPAFFLETLLSMVATINILNIVKTIDFVVMVIQVLIQTPLIMDGLRRCSNAKKLRRKKPGREVLMFLIIANVGMWIFYTFSYKSPESLDERYAYYGKVLWSILGHISLPLIMFYRFHSSVCFADIWDSAYKPGSEH